MKTHKRITLLGNNSGRNLGDAAIMSAILDLLSKKIPEVEVFVPSIKPDFITQNYGAKYNVKAVDVRPQKLSMRLLGLPTFLSILKSDVALICDGIIFGRKLFSPHNFLITLIFIVPFAKLVGCKVVCFSCGIGPFPSALSRFFAKWVIQLSDLIIMRENDSYDLAKKIGVTKAIKINGDAAFVNPISSDPAVLKIAKENNIDLTKPILGLNITPYIDSWLEKSERVESHSQFLSNYANAVNIFLDKLTDRPQCVIFSCSPMDEEFSKKLAEKVSGVVVDNSRYLSHDIQAMMSRANLLVGMRFHSLVLASASGAPIVGLVYAPKVKGYMRQLNCERFCIELKDISDSRFSDILHDAWENKVELKAKQQAIVSQLKLSAENAFDQLALMLQARVA